MTNNLLLSLSLSLSLSFSLSLSLSLSDHYKVSRFLPAYVKNQPAWKKTLSHLFEEYYQALDGREPDVIKVQYIYAYEKDIGCGQHLFQAKVQPAMMKFE